MKEAQFLNPTEANSHACSSWRGAYINERGEEVEITEPWFCLN